jgi:hypothetical protein
MGNRRAGDWNCPDCSAHNFASKTSCFKCNVPKPENMPEEQAPQGGGGGYGGGAPHGGYGGGGGFQNQRREGDWDCGACSAHNYASRMACYKCNAPKGEAGEETSAPEPPAFPPPSATTAPTEGGSGTLDSSAPEGGFQAPEMGGFGAGFGGPY